jgi:hypothetical protein
MAGLGLRAGLTIGSCLLLSTMDDQSIVALCTARCHLVSGRGDAGLVEYYTKAFPALITSWRTAFGQGDFPFYWVQLSPMVTISGMTELFGP